MVRTHQDPGRVTSRRCCLRTEPGRKQTQEVGQNWNCCRDITSPAIQSENGWFRRHLAKKPEIFKKNNSNPNSDCLNPRYILVITVRPDSNAPPGIKEIREKKDSDEKVLKKKQKNSLGEEIITSVLPDCILCKHCFRSLVINVHNVLRSLYHTQLRYQDRSEYELGLDNHR